jgi:hypothetical protein
MKYLKLFEQMEDKSYYVVPPDEIHNFERMKLVSISSLERILNILSKYEKHGLEVCDYHGANYIKFPFKNFKKEHVIISEGVDEWYRVTIPSRTMPIRYKCDQIDGLISCLKDNNFI